MARSILYLFDPLCGWCYGAGPAIHEVAQTTQEFTLAPTGLFARPNAIPMACFAQAARDHDKRICALSGQPFTTEYFENVLGQTDGMLDSHDATLALTAVHLTTPESELKALAEIQSARYRDGTDITALPELITLLEQSAWGDAAGLLKDAPDQVLAAMETRVTAARALSRRISARGVPTLVVRTDSGLTQIEPGDLFQPRQPLLKQLAAL